MRSQQGSILIAGIMMLGLFSMIFLRFYYVGTINHQVNRQRHALDAATYSGAVLQAQILNYVAYMNRAYTAHQIALAHLSSIAAWADMAETESGRAMQSNPPVALITMMFGADHGQAYAASRAATQSHFQSKSKGLLNLLKSHDAFTVEHYKPVSQSIYTTLAHWREQTIKQVLQDNYPEYDFRHQSDLFSLQIKDDSWGAFIGWQTSAAYAPWLKQQLEHYAFLSQRNWTKKNSWAVDSRCPHRRHELRRRGYTELDAHGHWRAEDTLSFHALRSNRWIGCYFREYPMGWAYIQGQKTSGSAFEPETMAPDNFSQEDFWRWVQANTSWNIFTGTQNPLATAWAKQNTGHWKSSGWVPLLRLNDPAISLSFSTRFSLSVSSDTKLSSQSGAETYFESPPQSQKSYENGVPSLFATHWLARLQHRSWFKPLAEWDKESL